MTERRKEGIMATGRKATDIFAKTTRPDIGLEVAPRIKGRPKTAEPYQKTTVVMYDRQVLHLDKVALAIRERTGRHVTRAELIRALIERIAADLDPSKPGFDEAVRGLLPEL